MIKLPPREQERDTRHSPKRQNTHPQPFPREDPWDLVEIVASRWTRRRRIMAAYDGARAPYAVSVFSRENETATLPNGTIKPSHTIREFFEFIQNFRIGDGQWVYR